MSSFRFQPIKQEPTGSGQLEHSNVKNEQQPVLSVPMEQPTEQTSKQDDHIPTSRDEHETQSPPRDESYYTEPISYQPACPSDHRSGASVFMSVHREEIGLANIQEGSDELRALNVDVYDQQTYERGVFDQVDRVIDDANSNADQAPNASNKDSDTNISDLMRVIHDQHDQGERIDQDCDTSYQQDDQILRLARQERLSRTIKSEQVERRREPAFANLPRVPRISTIKVEEGQGSSQSTLDRINQSTSNQEDDQSPGYRPPESDTESEDDALDDHDFETDSELGDRSDLYKGSNEQSSKRKSKNVQDDGDFNCYKARIRAYSRTKAKTRLDNIADDNVEMIDLDEMHQIEGDLQVPLDLWSNLFEHQKTGVKWLWELHQLGTGGILGDEMGLGKTIQMIAFLVALRSSNIKSAHKNYENLGPTVLVCPATVMHQWLLEFRKWWPSFRVAILHSTGTFNGDRKNLIRIMNKARGVLIVSYPGVVIYQDFLHALDWHYVILDEGHKIRNPDAQVTLACKRFRTPHRIILSGSPVQNNLKELWSIFDFIYPGKLGTLPVFMEQFAVPITQGGYANASDIQVQIAYKCACVLRATIKPFLLRRTKAEVNSKLRLPEKSEQVLFCKLTDRQRKLYEAYLDSPTVRDIKRGVCQIFVGLIELRKICNHPDLFDASESQKQIKKTQQVKDKRLLEFFSEDETYGHIRKSGKMMVVDALLKLWKEQGHKVLLFTQSRQMLKIFTNYLNERKFKHLVMDGTTPIGTRQSLIKTFNEDEEVFVFLLTTRVGGVGVNLIGADRIIIYDPDWNPSTDIQARERAWRIGQQRHVIIYRLLTAGTIEEKIYHRQVFKLYLTNRILRDAKQKRFFKTNDLHELFRLGDDQKDIETNALFDDDLQITAETVKRNKADDKRERKEKKLRKKKLASSFDEHLSEDKIQAMRERARQLSMMIATKYGQGCSEPNQISQTSPSRPIDVSTSVAHQEPERRVKSPAHVTIATAKATSNKKHVEFLVKQDIYEPTPSTSTSDKRFKRDDYILERLFKSSNIYGALKHDQIETDSTFDVKVVESEAEKVAKDAIKALKESRRLCSSSSTGIPNWTGKSGHIVERSRLAPKNNSRARLTTNQSSLTGLEIVKNDKDCVDSGMAKTIREFILFKSASSGEAQTDELLSLFNDNYPSNKSAVFKALLHSMCEFFRKGDKGFWRLKSEFRDQ